MGWFLFVGVQPTMMATAARAAAHLKKMGLMRWFRV